MQISLRLVRHSDTDAKRIVTLGAELRTLINFHIYKCGSAYVTPKASGYDDATREADHAQPTIG